MENEIKIKQKESIDSMVKTNKPNGLVGRTRNATDRVKFDDEFSEVVLSRPVKSSVSSCELAGRDAVRRVYPATVASGPRDATVPGAVVFVTARRLRATKPVAELFVLAVTFDAVMLPQASTVTLVSSIWAPPGDVTSTPSRKRELYDAGSDEDTTSTPGSPQVTSPGRITGY